jgi:hypothetical protein
MYCGQCGQQGAPGQRFCVACGTSLTIPELPAIFDLAALSTAGVSQGEPSQQVAFVPRNSTQALENADSAAREVKGWLWLFCFTHTIIAPLVNLVAVVDASDAVGKAIGFAFLIMQVWVGLSVWNLSPKAFRNLKIYYAVTLLLCLALVLVSDPTDAGKLGVPAILWLAYFQFSKRVKNTFGRNFF